MRRIRHLAHVVYAALVLHLSVLVTDRMKDAYADVLLDKAVTLALRATTGLTGE